MEAFSGIHDSCWRSALPAVATLQKKFGVEQLSQKLANLISEFLHFRELYCYTSVLSSGWRLTSVESASTDGSWLRSRDGSICILNMHRLITRHCCVATLGSEDDPLVTPGRFGSIAVTIETPKSGGSVWQSRCGGDGQDHLSNRRICLLTIYISYIADSNLETC